MAILEDNRPFTRWLFADNLKKEGNLIEITAFKQIKGTTGTEIPCFVVLGSDKETDAGEFYLSKWNIENFNELKQNLGSDSNNWLNKKFLATPKNGRIYLSEFVESQQVK